jgi:hypothetical protein
LGGGGLGGGGLGGGGLGGGGLGGGLGGGGLGGGGDLGGGGGLAGTKAAAAAGLISTCRRVWSSHEVDTPVRCCFWCEQCINHG